MNRSQSYPQFLLPQIGLSMSHGAAGAYEDKVATGAYDAAIEQVVVGLKGISMPASFRIGYEFNATWNGYHADWYNGIAPSPRSGSTRSWTMFPSRAMQPPPTSQRIFADIQRCQCPGPKVF